MVKNTLSYSQKKELDAWITKNWDVIVRSNMDREEIATKAMSELKMSISSANVKHMLKEMGKALPNVRRTEYVDVIARRAIADLYNQIGTKIPEEILPYLAKDAVKNG